MQQFLLIVFCWFVSAEDIKLHLVSKESKVQIGKSAYFELTIRCSIFTVNNNNNNFEIVQYKLHSGKLDTTTNTTTKNNKNHNNNKTINTNTAYLY